MAVAGDGGTLRWQRGQVLGKGRHGVVYLALNEANGQMMAAKAVDVATGPLGEADPKLIRRMRREIDIMSRLDHPNIVRYLGHELQGTTFYMLMEYIPGGTLRRLRSRFGAMRERLVRRYTRQIVDGLVYLHDHGVAHRDVKGANILVAEDGTLKLADFGTAKHVSLAQTLSARGAVGTPNWMAPEATRAAPAPSVPGDSRSPRLGAAASRSQPRVARSTADWMKADVWSTACTVIEMVTGKAPWPQLSNPITVLFHIAYSSETPAVPESLSPEGKAFLRSCFQRDPHLRPTARELLRHPFLDTSSPRGQEGGGSGVSDDWDCSGLDAIGAALAAGGGSGGDRPHGARRSLSRLPSGGNNLAASPLRDRGAAQRAPRRQSALRHKSSAFLSAESDEEWSTCSRSDSDDSGGGRRNHGRAPWPGHGAGGDDAEEDAESPFGSPRLQTRTGGRAMLVSVQKRGGTGSAGRAALATESRATRVAQPGAGQRRGSSSAPRAVQHGGPAGSASRPRRTAFPPLPGADIKEEGGGGSGVSGGGDGAGSGMLAPWRLGKMLLRRLGSKRAVPRAGGGAPPPGHPSTDTLGGAHLARPGDDAGDDGSSDEEAVGRAARASRARREAARTAAGGGGVDASLGSTLRSFASPRSTAEQRVETPLGVPALDLEPLQRQPQGGAGASAGEGKPSKLGGAAAAGRTPAQKQFLRRYTGSDKGVAGEGGAPCGRLQPLGSLVGSRGGIARRRLSSGSSTRREVTDDEGGDSEARGGTDRADEAGTSGSSPSDTESASHDGLEKAAEGGGESGPPRSSATASTWGRESPVGFWLEDSAAANARGPRVAPAADPCIPPYALTATWRVAVRQQPAVVGIARWWLRAARASAQAPPAHGNGLARAIGRHAWQQAQQQRVGEPGPVAVARTGLSRSRAWGGAMGGGEAESARSSLSREASDAAEGEDEEDGEEEEEAWGGAGVQRGTSWSSAEPPGWQSQREPQGVERVGGFAIVRVVAALEAESEGELSLAEGMRLAVVEKDASGWWLGRVVGVPLTGEGGSGSTASMAATATEAPPGAPSLLREGWFPCTYAEWCMPGEASNRSWVSIASARDLAHIPRQDRLVESAVPEEDAEDLDAGSVSPH